MRVVFITLATISLLLIRAVTVECQVQDGAAKSKKVVSQETYNRVLDIVFPRNEPAGNYYLVLRFRPSFHPTSQVVIKRGEYTSLSGNIYSTLNELMSNGAKEDARDAKTVETVYRITSARKSPG